MTAWNGTPDEPERWEPIRGYEGLYEASSFGRVRAIGAGKARRHGRVLRPSLGGTGYLRVSLSAGNQSKTLKVHRLVAEAFHGKAPVAAFVLHRDGCSTNNTPSNLYFGDARDNVLDAIRHGTWCKREGEAVHTARLTRANVIAIRGSRLQSTELAREFGVSPTAIKDIRAGRTWKHV